MALNLPRRHTEVAAPGRVPPLPRDCALARLAVGRVLAATRAELLQLNAVRVVTAVLTRGVVALLALHTRPRDLLTGVGRLGHRGGASSRGFLMLRRTRLARAWLRPQSGARCLRSGGRT